MPRIKPIYSYNELSLEFFKLGFMTRDAFVNICTQLDDNIADWELNILWEFNISNENLTNRINNVLELLKNE